MLEVTDDTFDALIREWVNYLESPNINPRPSHGMSQWDVSQVTDFEGAFISASKKLFTFPGNDIGDWKFGPGPFSMDYMFWRCSYVPPSIAKWNVSNVISMQWMFEVYEGDDDAMNVPVQAWNVSNVVNMSYMFSGRKRFNQPIGTWDVSNVINMGRMFGNCRAFNQPLGDWNVSNVKYMPAMFYGCRAFNQPLSRWNVEKVIEMGGMFSGADSFNQSLASWKIHKQCLVRHMLASASFSNYPPAFPKELLNEPATTVFGRDEAAIYRLYQQTRTTNPYLQHCSATPTVGEITRNVRAIVFPAVLELWMVDQLATMEPNLLHDTTQIDDIRRRLFEFVGFA